MTKKILTRVTEYEINEYQEILERIMTYRTLGIIANYNTESLNKIKLKKEYAQCVEKLSEWWNNINEKYELDAYKKIYVNFDDNTLYIIEG